MDFLNEKRKINVFVIYYYYCVYNKIHKYSLNNILLFLPNLSKVSVTY